MTHCIKRRYFACLSLVAVAVAFLVHLPAQEVRAAGDATRRPKLNIVLILIDDLGWRDLSCFGSTFYETPHTDRLAKHGMKFTNAYAACCVCSPTRASILTGKYPARLHLTDYIPGAPRKNAKLHIPDWTQHLALDEVTLARALKPAGYVSACIGKWHLDSFPVFPETKKEPRFSPEKHGFQVNIAGSHLGQPPDYFYPYQRKYPNNQLYRLSKLPGGRPGEYLTGRLTDEAEKFMERNQNRPFFLYMAHYAVHTAMGARLQAKPEKIAKYKKKQKHGAAQQNAAYAAMVESMDESVGRLMRKLEKLKIADRTLVIFTSDNGGMSEATSNVPLRGAKGTPYEGGVRVPLIVSWPGVVKPGMVNDSPVSSVDLYPTILEAAAVKVGSKQVVDGESLVSLLQHKAGLRRPAIYWHYPHYSDGTTPNGAIRQGDYKLIEFYEDKRVELYNLKKDLSEKKDLAKTEPANARGLQQLLARWRKQVGAQMPAVNPAYRGQ